MVLRRGVAADGNGMMGWRRERKKKRMAAAAEREGVEGWLGLGLRWSL